MGCEKHSEGWNNELEGKENLVPAGYSPHGQIWRGNLGPEREAERRRLNMIEMKCLRPMVEVTRWDMIRIEEIQRRAVIEETLAEKVDR